jgi:SAM-dependent methyltransferase
MFHKVAICKDCGHIQLHPLFDEEEYAIINEKFFNRKYLVADRQNPHNVKKKRKLDERISPYLWEGCSVLDVGPGEGWAMSYFQERKCSYFAIEPIGRFALSIEKRGGTVIGRSLFDRYPDFENHFDIVLCRHVLEHMLDPRGAMLRLKSFLNSNGVIYLELPNAGNPSIGKGFRTSYLRPVHISYFCEGNIVRLARSAGLELMQAHSNNEVCCLLKYKGKRKFRNYNFYAQQKRIFLKKKHEALLKDMYNIYKILMTTLIYKR